MREAGSVSSSNKKIGYVVKRFPRMSETFILNELRGLKAIGRNVEVLSLLPPEAEQQFAMLAELDLPVSYLPGREALSALIVGQHNYATGKHREHSLRKLLRQAQNADAPALPFPGKRASQCSTLQVQAAVLASLAAAKNLGHLHAHFASDAATVAMLASRLSGIPFSMTAHAKDIYHTYSERERDHAFLATKLKEARFTVTVSDYNRQYLDQIAGGKATIYRLYNGMDLQRLQPAEGDIEQGLIVGVGRLVDKKGFNYLIKACALLARAGAEFRCVLIGDGPQRETLASMIAKYRLDNHMEMLGAMPQAEVHDWLRRATVFALPCVVSESGDRDGLPTVLLEAMALGTPSITTRVAGIPEMIDDGETGWLIEPNHEQALADALQQALSQTCEERKRMARTARRKAEACFNLFDNVRELDALFSDDTLDCVGRIAAVT